MPLFQVISILRGNSPTRPSPSIYLEAGSSEVGFKESSGSKTPFNFTPQDSIPLKNYKLPSDSGLIGVEYPVNADQVIGLPPQEPLNILGGKLLIGDRITLKPVNLTELPPLIRSTPELPTKSLAPDLSLKVVPSMQLMWDSLFFLQGYTEGEQLFVPLTRDVISAILLDSEDRFSLALVYPTSNKVNTADKSCEVQVFSLNKSPEFLKSAGEGISFSQYVTEDVTFLVGDMSSIPVGLKRDSILVSSKAKDLFESVGFSMKSSSDVWVVNNPEISQALRFGLYLLFSDAASMGAFLRSRPDSPLAKVLMDNTWVARPEPLSNVSPKAPSSPPAAVLANRDTVGPHIRISFVKGINKPEHRESFVSPVWNNMTVSGVKMGCNPHSWEERAENNVKVYKTLARQVEEHYVEDLDTITFSGSTLSFFLRDTERPNAVEYNYTQSGFLIEGPGRRSTSSYAEMRSLVTLIRSNGVSYFTSDHGWGEDLKSPYFGKSKKGDKESYNRWYRFFSGSTNGDSLLPMKSHPRAGMVAVRYPVRIEYGSKIAYGFFTDFNLTEDASIPYRFEYSATFKVEFWEHR